MTYSVRQAAERFAVSQHTVLAWIRTGELAAINVGRSALGKPHWRITPDSLQAFELLRSAQPHIDRPRRRRKRSADVVKFY